MCDKETGFVQSTKGEQKWPPTLVNPRMFPNSNYVEATPDNSFEVIVQLDKDQTNGN